MFSAVFALAVAFATQALALPAGPLPVPSSVSGGVAIPTPHSASTGNPWWQPPPSSVPPTVDICAAVSKAVPFQRAYVGGATSAADHFYTTDSTEMSRAILLHGYKKEVDTGKVHTSQESGTIPLYRLNSVSASDHYYTTSAVERDNAINNYGYTNEGIAAYVYEGQICGSVPLYMLWSASASDHFYTTSQAEANASGYSLERVVGYVLPA